MNEYALIYVNGIFIHGNEDGNDKVRFVHIAFPIGVFIFAWFKEYLKNHVLGVDTMFVGQLQLCEYRKNMPQVLKEMAS